MFCPTDLDVLLNGRVEYNVKLFGSQEVKEAKGTDVIRDAIHAIQFQNGVKRFESTQSAIKLQKVDLQINIEGVTIVDSKSKMVLYRYPLQKISFCADDKQDKRIFSFITKSQSDPDKHNCFVFLSDKMAEQITLTVGEAFDLAYKF
ncbi:phosphotyrosine interaction domain protein [Dictyocaulus viviparus]|uniref:Phosphotyrosine interaction domain protein n=1 Tax=Dictyocaulus viviparus TaxID=29172 RepID=A0A0D8Y275_DICVI|nr:phosphotyrosine interaction domain protein [Dictyocaulus viviparus]